MKIRGLHLPKNYRETLDRFVAACQDDPRIVAAFIGGSYAAGQADAYSDLDLYFITTDAAYTDFLSEREIFIQRLGQPLFLEDFGLPNGYLAIFDNGAEADVFFGREGQYKDIYGGPIRVLVDKNGLLDGQTFPPHRVDPAKQGQLLRQQIDWFWHDLSHYIKAMGRGQLWFAYGELEVLRRICANLAHLRHDFTSLSAGDEPYFKVEQYLPVGQLEPLAETICPLEYGAMLQAGWGIFNYYQSVAPDLARQHGIPYPAQLEQIMRRRLEALDR